MTIIKRADLGRPLTWDELDDNFEQVDSLTAAASAAVSSATASATAAAGSATNAATSATDAANSAANAAAAVVSAVKSTVTFTTGGTLNSNLDRISDGTYLYYWTGTYPITVPAGSTVEGTGGIAAGFWAVDNDLVLRDDLSSATGETLIGMGDGGTLDDYIMHRSITAYGAVSGLTTFDNQNIIQNAINDANADYLATGSIHSVYVPPGVFYVGNRNIIPTGEVSAYGILSVQIKSGVRLYGEGTIKAIPSAYGSGAFYRIIGSDRGAAPSNIIIEGINLDGNVGSQIASTQASNMVIEVADNVTVKNVTSVNSNGLGMMVRGLTTRAATNIKIQGCTVINCTNIGIQSSQFNGLVISNNYVATTGNNAIDIYGDTSSSGSPSNGVNFSIVNNTVRDSAICGIFPETVANGTISGNSIYNCAEGIHINRILNVPKNITVSGNSIYGSTSAAIFVSGDMQGVLVSGNTISDFSTGVAIQLGTASGNISNVTVCENYINPTVATNYILSIIAATASRIEVRNNVIRNNIGITSAFIYSNTATTSSGVNVDSWALTAGSVESTGFQMFRTSTTLPTIRGLTTQTSVTVDSVNSLAYFERHGGVVNFSIKLVYSALVGTGALAVSSLPWTPASSSTKLQPFCFCTHSAISISTLGQRVVAAPNTTGLTIRTIQDGSTTVTNADAATYTSGTVYISGQYYV